MSITRLNHAVLYVRDAKRSSEFYQKMFDMEVVVEMTGASFLKSKDSNNDHDLGLFSLGEQAPILPLGSTVGLYHLAWQVETLEDLKHHYELLKNEGFLVGASDHGTTKSVYGHDIDNIDFEIMWIVPVELLEEQDTMKTSALDFDKEIKRFGLTLPGRHL